MATAPVSTPLPSDELLLVIVDALGVRLDHFFSNFFKLCPLSKDERAVLKASIAERGVLYAIRAATIVGEDGPPVVYDGHNRLTILAELRAEGVELPLPPLAVDAFDSRAEAVPEMVRLQRGRRSHAPVAFAHSVMSHSSEIEKLEKQAKQNLKTKGQPLARAPKPRVNVRKSIARMTGVGEKTVDVIRNAQESNPELLRRMLLPTTAPEYLSVRQADRTLKRDAHELRKSLAYKQQVARQEAVKNAAAAVVVPDRIEPNSLVCMDAIHSLERIEAETVSLIVTSPPYPISKIAYDCWKYEDYQSWLRLMEAFFAGTYRALRRGGRVVVNVDATGAAINGGGLPGQVLHNVYADLSAAAAKAGLQFFGEWVWYKQQVSGGSLYGTNWGTFRSPQAPRIRRNHEYLIVFSKETATLEGDPLGCDMTTKEFKDFTLSHWYIRPEPRKDPRHPDFHCCPFPEELPYRLVKMLTYKDDLVVDPFMGSGTVPFVARALGRRYVGIDNSPLHFASCQRRLAKLDNLSPEQRLAAITRFVPAQDERVDGYLAQPPNLSGTSNPRE